MKLKFLLLLILFSCLGQQAFSQVPGYDLTFNQIFDNREYFSEYAFPQTIFGARLDASLSFEIDSIHSFSSGISYFYENGSSISAQEPKVILYYQYKGSNLDMAFGSFPREERIDLPALFLNDTLNYYRPNVEGALLSYKGRLGKVEGFIDWTGRVSENSRETFLVGLNSHLVMGHIFLKPSFLMYHNARSYSALDSIPLQDNGVVSFLAGYDLGNNSLPYDFSFSAGGVASYNRFRPQDFSWGRGILVNINFGYTIFGLKGVYYFGTPIEFTYGDPFYRSGNYGRLDFYVDPFKNSRVKSKIGWNLHIVPGEGLHHSQQILISVVF